MNIRRKRVLFAVLSAAIAMSGFGAAAHAAGEPLSEAAAAETAQAAPKPHRLTSALQVEIKGIAADRTADGMRVGAVVKVTNKTNNNARVPEYELQIRTAEGVSYTLGASATNSRFVRPQSEAELSYMVDIKGITSIDVTELLWVDVDYYVYPKKETVMLNIPIIGKVWKGAADDEGVTVSGWGQPFTLQALSSSLVYTPVSFNEQATPQGLTKVIKLLVKNTGLHKATVPTLMVEGNDGTETFSGARAETGDVVLEPGEDTFIHLILPMKPNSVFQDVTVGTMESFSSTDDGTMPQTVFRVGHVKLMLPTVDTPVLTVPFYKIGDPVDLSRVTDVVPKDVKVSLVEVSIFEPPGSGYKTIITKVKVQNDSNKSLPIPPLMAEIAGKDGGRYAGMRQTDTAAEVLPGLATVVSYAFAVPLSETGENVTLKLQEPVLTASGTTLRSDLVGVKINAEQPGNDKTFSFYPYTVTLHSSSLTAMYNMATGYSYKLRLDLDIAKEEKVVTDRDFSLMEIEIVDRLGRALGSTELSFVGPLPNGNRQLLSGQTVAYFTDLRTEQQETDLSIRIYEKIETPLGPVKRLITTVK